MALAKLTRFLDERGIQYTLISHSAAYTAQMVAEATHIHGKELVKTVMIKADDELMMAVMPASYRIQFEQLMDALGALELVLAEEKEFKERFPGCEAGAMLPFGSLFGIRCIACTALKEGDEIAFSAGSHTEVIRMRGEDFIRLAQPILLDTGFVPIGPTPPRMRKKSREYVHH